MVDQLKIAISATLNKNAEADLQKELDKIAKKLKLTIQNISVANQKLISSSGSTESATTKATQAISKYEQSLNNLIHLYKMKEVTDRQFLDTMEKLRAKTEFTTLSQQKQEQVVRLLTQAEKNYQKVSDESVNIIKRYNDELEKISRRNFNFGTLVTGVDSSTFKSRENFLSYIKQQYGESAELIGKFNDKQLKTGEIITQANFRVKEGSDKWRMYQATLNKTTGEMRLLDNGLRDVINRQISFSEAFKIAVTRIAQWGIATSLVYGSLRRLKESINYITEIDNSLNEIRIVTNKTQEEVNSFAKSYNSLAKEMNATTKEVVATSADLYRQGLNDSQVEERMKAIIQYAKISKLSLEESSKIITATANATGESVEKIIDIFAYLGRFCPAA